MPGEARFKYVSTPAYTAIPCYSHPNVYYLDPSLDSSGRCTSIDGGAYYYPTIFI